MVKQHTAQHHRGSQEHKRQDRAIQDAFRKRGTYDLFNICQFMPVLRKKPWSRSTIFNVVVVASSHVVKLF